MAIEIGSCQSTFNSVIPPMPRTALPVGTRYNCLSLPITDGDTAKTYSGKTLITFNGGDWSQIGTQTIRVLDEEENVIWSRTSSDVGLDVTSGAFHIFVNNDNHIIISQIGTQAKFIKMDALTGVTLSTTYATPTITSGSAGTSIVDRFDSAQSTLNYGIYTELGSFGHQLQDGSYEFYYRTTSTINNTYGYLGKLHMEQDLSTIRDQAAPYHQPGLVDKNVDTLVPTYATLDGKYIIGNMFEGVSLTSTINDNTVASASWEEAQQPVTTPNGTRELAIYNTQDGRFTRLSHPNTSLWYYVDWQQASGAPTSYSSSDKFRVGAQNSAVWVLYLQMNIGRVFGSGTPPGAYALGGTVDTGGLSPMSYTLPASIRVSGDYMCILTPTTWGASQYTVAGNFGGVEIKGSRWNKRSEFDAWIGEVAKVFGVSSDV